ncbi:hypothetical protein [uncultured Dokdonia sp.]|uniref:hypothetical protein n=1 Tax=uncultured Dokdonia sp. TaxID=575653 RepID=UPI002631626C|nr:hypothetical protein [uncultured Dokdonia sp.]
METKQLIKERSKFQAANKKTKNRILISGTLIALSLIISPYLFTLYDLFPDDIVWESPFGTYTSTYYESVNVAAWTLFGKLIPLYFLLLWFFTCKHWWYHAILVPICLYTWQIYGILNDDIVFPDVNDIYVLAPLVLIMAIFSYTIRTKIFDKIHGIDLSELSRVNWKGELQSYKSIDDEDEDEEPMYMSRE